MGGEGHTVSTVHEVSVLLLHLSGQAARVDDGRLDRRAWRVGQHIHIHGHKHQPNIVGVTERQ